MGSKHIGIEIGSDTLKMTVMKNGVVQKMAVERMPDNLVREGRMVSIPAFSSFVKDMMKAYRIPRGNCSLVLPPRTVVSMRVNIPVMSENELKLNLPYEFREYVGKDVEKYDYDYIVNGIRGGVMSLYAAAVRKQLVEDYYAALKKAGLTLKQAMPVEMAWLNVVSRSKSMPEKYAIVDLGHHTTRVAIFAKGDYIMGKDIEMGGSLMDETIAQNMNIDSFVARTRKESNMDHILDQEFLTDAYNRIALEVMKAINFYNFTRDSEDSLLKDVYVCGGASFVEPLCNAIEKATDVRISPVSRMLDMGGIDRDMAAFCALSAGAAMQTK